MGVIITATAEIEADNLARHFTEEPSAFFDALGYIRSTRGVALQEFVSNGFNGSAHHLRALEFMKAVIAAIPPAPAE
jgi:hypothetical protein